MGYPHKLATTPLTGHVEVLNEGVLFLGTTALLAEHVDDSDGFTIWNWDLLEELRLALGGV
jgi:hypothetical protein